MGELSRLSTLESVEELLRSRFDDTFLTLKDLPDPYAFKDMDRAVERLVLALSRGEKILLVGDYDVDGVSATAIVRKFFEAIGHPLEWVIPNRFRDGYGLSPTLFPRLKHADVILTVDNGIAAVEAARLCKDAGIDLIITDHHIVPETPPEAYAIVNQKQSECSFPHEEVCGAQIAWYLCAALNRRLEAGVDMKELLELVALAIVADIMPLRHINRAMLQAGLKLLSRSQSPFMQAWRAERGGEEMSAEEIGFFLAPMLNSAGRMEDASVACDFLCASDLREASQLLDRLRGYNARRKALEEEITAEAAERVRGDEPVLVLAGEEWHEGVLGIVAARLARRFERPALVLSREGERYKGSGRSYGGCDLFGLVSGVGDRLEKFGGHRAAVGLSLPVSELESFSRELRHRALEFCDNEEGYDPDLLGEIPLELVGWELYRILETFEPYGEANPRPKFLSRGVEILQHRSLGADGNHQKYLFKALEKPLEGIAFKTNDFFPVGSRVDLIYTLGVNRFNGRVLLQLRIEKIYITNYKK